MRRGSRARPARLRRRRSAGERLRYPGRMDHSTDDAAAHGPTERLEQQVAFILELDKLKRVTRRAYLLSNDRRENSAEHRWHVALMALVLAEHSDEPINRERVMKMLT